MSETVVLANISTSYLLYSDFLHTEARYKVRWVKLKENSQILTLASLAAVHF